MEVRWWWYAAVSVAAIAMTLLIVGLPDDSPSGTLQTADASAAATSSAPAPEPAAGTTLSAAPVGDESTTTTVVPEEPAAADEPESTTTTSEVRRRRRPTTTVQERVTTTSVEAVDDLDDGAELPVLADPASLHVVIVNGSGVDGEAGRFAEGVRGFGYPDVSITNGDQQIESTRVFFVDPLWLEAVRLADEFELDPTTVALLEEAPGFAAVDDEPDLVVFLGRDRAA